MIHVLAFLKTVPGERENLRNAFRDLIPLVRAEPGCLEYGTAVDLPTGLDPQEPADPDLLIVIEKWDDVQRLKDHLVASHMNTFREQHGHRIASLRLRVLEP